MIFEVLLKTELLSPKLKVFHHVFSLSYAPCLREPPCKKDHKGFYVFLYLIMMIPQSGFIHLGSEQNIMSGENSVGSQD